MCHFSRNEGIWIRVQIIMKRKMNENKYEKISDIFNPTYVFTLSKEKSELKWTGNISGCWIK